MIIWGKNVQNRFLLSELPGVDALQPGEEPGERGGFGEVQAIGYIHDGERGLLQQEGGLHQEHLVDVVDDGET